ncbi:MAG: hypothetical protein ACLQF0_05230 [Dissulfurispiraceae bacterium]
MAPLAVVERAVVKMRVAVYTMAERGTSLAQPLASIFSQAAWPLVRWATYGTAVLAGPSVLLALQIRPSPARTDSADLYATAAILTVGGNACSVRVVLVVPALAASVPKVRRFVALPQGTQGFAKIFKMTLKTAVSAGTYVRLPKMGPPPASPESAELSATAAILTAAGSAQICKPTRRTAVSAGTYVRPPTMRLPPAPAESADGVATKAI